MSIDVNSDVTLVNVAEAATLSGCSQSLILSLVQNNRFPEPVHRRPWLWDADDVVRWVRVTSETVKRSTPRPKRKR
jgi:predicted DNA-binding transcriptional regulator AlpA